MIVSQKSSRPGFIRYTLTGFVVCAIGFAMIRPLCLWAVVGGSWLEGMLQ